MFHYIFISQTLSIIYLYRDVSSQFLPAPYPMAPQMAPMRMPMPGVPAPMSPMMPMPMPAPAVPFPVVPQQKLPVVVMPFYSKSANQRERERDQKKNKKKQHNKRTKSRNYRRNVARYHSGSASAEGSSSCDSASSENSNEYEMRSSKRTKLKNTRRQVLTPVVSYVTKDGYVIYQKKIRKDKARDWLQLGEKDRVIQKSNEILESDDEGHSHGTRKSRSSHHQH